MKTKLKIVCAIILLSIITTPLASQVDEMPLTTSSDEALELFKKGRDLQENFKGEKAFEFYEKAVNLDPDFAIAHMYLSWTSGSSSKWKKYFDKACNLKNKVSEGERLLIEYFRALADKDGVKRKEKLDGLLRLFPKDKRVQLLAGSYYYASDKNKAIEHYTKSTEIDNEYTPAYNSLGYIYMAKDDYVNAEIAFKKYIELAPDIANSYDSYAEFLQKNMKYDESIAQYKKALEKDPTFHASLIGIGNNYIFKNEYDEARKYYYLGLENAKNTNLKLGAYYWIATSYVHQANYKKAIEIFKQRKRVAEKENDMYGIINSVALQGFIANEQGDYQKAIQTANKVIKIVKKSNLSEAQKNNFYLDKISWDALNNARINKISLAREKAKEYKLKVEKRNNPWEKSSALAIYGYIEFLSGNFEKSIEYYSEAKSENPYDWFYEAMAYKKAKNNVMANKKFSKITNYSSNSIMLATVRTKAINEIEKLVEAQKN